MRRTVYKVFWVWQHEKEEQWLNDMSADGLQLCEVGYCRYVFEPGEPGEYIYRLEMLNYSPTHAKSIDYIEFIEGTGAELVGTLFKWVYFRKKAGDGGFDLFSDIDSRLKHLHRLFTMMGIFAAANLLSGVSRLHALATDGLAFHRVPGTGILPLLVGGLLGYGALRLHFIIRRLKKEKVLHE